MQVTGDGYNFAKVRMRNLRVPSIGDKVSCYTGDHQVGPMPRVSVQCPLVGGEAAPLPPRKFADASARERA